ncbi:PAS domain-containing protein [Gloeobacter violaceus]|nr:PAS domain-containing protein [Gloeobacter violaceus]
MDDWHARFLLECIPQMAWSATPDGRLECANQLCLEYTGLALEQICGWGWRSVVHPEDWLRCTVPWCEALRTGQAYELEYRLRRRRDGAFLWHLARGRPVHDGDVQVIRWFGTCTDIHRYKMAEQRWLDLHSGGFSNN